jgi:hypothetical protein
VSVAPILRLAYLSDDESDLVNGLLTRLSYFAAANDEAEKRYDGSWTTTNLGISIPPSMSSLRTVAGWPGTSVDVLEERLDWLGWTGDDTFGLDEVYSANGLGVDAGMAHLDSLIFGVSFVSVGSGAEGEPSPLIATHSPTTTTAVWDRRTRRLRYAVSAVSENGQVSEATLYTPDATIRVGLGNPGGRWVVTDRDDHQLGRVPIVMMPNRVRGSRDYGRSEITHAVRYYSDAAARTLLGLEVNREFYNSPQRVVLGASEDMFKDAAGNTVSQWSAIMGRVWAVPNDDEGSAPSVQQFQPASPAPYLDQVKGYAQLLAAEAGIPAAYLGFQTDNPASADAIRAGEARLVKRAERRQAVFGRAWHEVGRLALLVRDGSVPAGFDLVSERWRDAATPTRAAAADEATKLIASNVLPADSSVTYDRLGLTPAEQRQIDTDKRRVAGRDVLAALRQQAGPVAVTDVDGQ